jgi:cyanophycinase
MGKDQDPVKSTPLKTSQASNDDSLVVQRRRNLAQGPVLAIGGHEEKSGQTDILDRFVEAAGGKRARIAVIAAASQDPEAMLKDYQAAFGKIGIASVDMVDIRTRENANSDEALKLLTRATGIFVTGGSQDRLVELLIGTRAMDAIRARNAEGVIVGGTSAGASLVPEHMLLGGTSMNGGSGDSAARKDMVQMVGGLGLVSDTIIDQHFNERGRTGRLLSAFASNPGLVGIGLDEDTAVFFHEDGRLETLGKRGVTIVDGRNAISDYFERESGEVLTIHHISMHVLGPGRAFDVVAHKPLDRIGISASDAEDDPST